jgi:hypothetical protein
MTEHFKPKPGEKYRHFKGALVEIVGTFKDSENPKKQYFAYIHLDTKEGWVRPIEMWFQQVVWPDGETRPRFIRVP